MWSRLLPPSPPSPSLRGSRLSVMPLAPLSQVQSTQPLAKAASKASQGGGPLAVVGGPLPAADESKRCVLEQDRMSNGSRRATSHKMTDPVIFLIGHLYKFGPLPVTVLGGSPDSASPTCFDVGASFSAGARIPL